MSRRKKTEEPLPPKEKYPFEFEVGDKAYSFLFGWVQFTDITEESISFKILANSIEKEVSRKGILSDSFSFTEYSLAGYQRKKTLQPKPGQWCYFRDKGDEMFVFGEFKSVNSENRDYSYQLKDNTCWEECYIEPPVR